MWNWLDFVVVIFAASAIVDVWKNGSIFADWRAFFENDEPASGDTSVPTVTDVTGNTELPFLMLLADRWLPRRVGELLSCSYCLSHHTPWIVSVVLIFPATLSPDWLAFLLRVPAYSLAATRIGNLLNASVPEDSRYDRFK